MPLLLSVARCPTPDSRRPCSASLLVAPSSTKRCHARPLRDTPESASRATLRCASQQPARAPGVQPPARQGTLRLTQRQGSGDPPLHEEAPADLVTNITFVCFLRARGHVRGHILSADSWRAHDLLPAADSRRGHGSFGAGTNMKPLSAWILPVAIPRGRWRAPMGIWFL